MKNTIFIAITLLVAGCTDPVGAKEAVEAMGLHDVTTGGFTYGCGQDDTYATSFEATNANGDRVRGVVCGGVGVFGKSNTVRIDGIIQRAAPK